MKITQSEKKHIFRLFARGKTPEQVVEELGNSTDRPTKPPITISRAERLLEEYINLPIGEKLRLTLMAECVSNRLHRLMDDISDLRRVDDLLGGGSEKTLALLLDIKRKIKERMAKEFATGAEDKTEAVEEEIDDEVEKYYEEIVDNAAPPAQVR